MSLFNRPAWARSQTTELGESDSNLFSHSDRSYRDIVAEQERKRKEKAERQKAKEERRRSSGKHGIKDEPGEDGVAKRRRITLEDGEALLNSVRLPSAVEAGTQSEDDEFESVSAGGPSKRRSPRLNRKLNKVSPQKLRHRKDRAEVVEIEDADSEDEPIVLSASGPAPEAEAIEDESDEEFAELKQRARLQREQKKLQDRHSGTPDVAPHSPSPGIGTTSADRGQRSLPTPPPDPIVQFLISSRIPNTNPLIVQRKLSQRTEEIRKAWCRKQGFLEEMWNDVFFIHRMRRIYDVTTCRSLGLEVDAFGNLTMKGAEGKEGVEKVHLEAVTEEIFQEMKDEREQESKRRSGELPPEDSTEAGAAEEEHPKEESFIRLTMKGKGKEDFKLKVKPVSPPMTAVHRPRQLLTCF